MDFHFKINNFIPVEDAKVYFDILSKSVAWETFKPSPNSRKVYKYKPPTIIDPLIHHLISRIESEYKTSVKGVFMNIYEDGNDHCPYHKDMYGMDVFTISLGSTRDLLIKRDGKNTKATKITLNSGDLYFMDERLHLNHKHSIPKRTRVLGSRISVVFFAKV
jgi:alkylated DNA repair dioxygenase AlkB